MNTVTELLQTARNIIAEKEHWTKGAYARDAENNIVHDSGPEAVCFCSIGALMKADSSEMSHDYHDATFALTDTLGERRRIAQEAGTIKPPRNVATFNDHNNTTHEDVLRLFDDTIQRLQTAE